MKARTILSGAVSTVRLVSSLFVIRLTLGWKVRRARRAFEEQLIKEGMSKKDAKRLSRRYASLKDKVMSTVWSFVIRRDVLHQLP